MPEFFVNGGSPNYLGFSFTDSTSLLTQIHDSLQTGGWISITNTPGSNLIELTGTAIETPDTCHIRLTTSLVSGSQYNLNITLSQQNTFVTNSPTLPLRWENGFTNRLWIGGNQDYANFCIQSFSGEVRTIHAGFLDRVDPLNDPYGYAIGYVNNENRNSLITGQSSPNSYMYYVAKAAHDGANWDSGFTRFVNQSGDISFVPGKSSTVFSAYVSGTFNRHASCLCPYNTFSDTNTRNASRNGENGNINALNNKTILGEYFRVEGRGSSLDYAVTGQLPPLIYFRGVVKGAVVGMSHLLGGVQIEDALGRRFISGGDLRWQGIQIKGAN